MNPSPHGKETAMRLRSFLAPLAIAVLAGACPPLARAQDAGETPAAPAPPTATGAPAGFECVDLGTLGGASSAPTGINAAGTVVGASLTTPTEDGDAGFGGESVRHACLWRDGKAID